MTMPTNCSIFCFIAANEMSWSAWTDPTTRPVSCCGKKPVGTLVYKTMVKAAVRMVIPSVSGWCRNTRISTAR